MSDISNQYSDADARDATHDKYTDEEARRIALRTDNGWAPGYYG